jgi:hypothetical protein
MTDYFLHNAGFTDIEQNPDGTFDATFNKRRYQGLRFKGMSHGYDKEGEQILAHKITLNVTYAACEPPA